MLKKQERLGREAFNRLFSLGKRANSPHFQLIYSPKSPFGASVVVSKKIAKTAVARNKLRRQSYDIIRRHKTVSGMTGGIILLAKKGAHDLSFEKLKAEIVDLIGGITKSR